jgi:transcriptional regulator with XRE-family HTH domain
VTRDVRSPDDREIRRLLGMRIRELRLARGLSQEAVAERGGRITCKHVGEIERAESNPSATSLVRIAYGIGVAVGELFATLPPPAASTPPLVDPERPPLQRAPSMPRRPRGE